MMKDFSEIVWYTTIFKLAQPSLAFVCLCISICTYFYCLGLNFIYIFQLNRLVSEKIMIMLRCLNLIQTALLIFILIIMDTNNKLYSA